MTRPTEAPSTVPPTIDALMVRFLASRSDAVPAAVESGEGLAEPHEVAAGFRVDPRAAWLDATAAHTTGGNAPAPAGPQPPEWAALVARPSPALALPMAPGHFPQCVNDLHPLIAKFDANDLRPSGPPAVLPGFGGLRKWVERHAGDPVAAGVGRMLGDASGPDPAARWLRGECAAALAAWDAEPESPAGLFNRGMGRLFFGRYAEARELLARAVGALPEASGWHALARLYLAVAEIHG